MADFTLDDVRQRTYKARDAWWTVLLVDPLASRLVKFTANRTRITPNQLTVGALILGLAAGACFAAATPLYLAIGALLYHLSFTLDCMDGKIARLKGTGSVFGAWLDYIFDRIRVLACAITLMAGQYHHTGNTAYIWTALAVVFLDMLRYMDALEIYKVRDRMRTELAAARAERAALHAVRTTREEKGREESVGQEDLGAEDVAAEEPDAEELGAEDLAAEGLDAEEHLDAERLADGSDARVGVAEPSAEARLHRDFARRFPWYAGARDRLRRARVRPHLVSGIEFQMAIFIIGPLAAAFAPGALIPVVAAAGAALLAFELVIVYKFRLAAGAYGRELARLRAAGGTADGTGGTARSPGGGAGPAGVPPPGTSVGGTA